MRATLKVLLFWALLTYLCYLLVSLFSFLVFEHNDFVTFFKSHYPSAYRIDEFGGKYFSPGHYRFVTYITILLGLFFLALIVLLISKRRIFDRWTNGLIDDISWLKDIVVTSIKSVSKSGKLIMLACFSFLAILKVYFFFVLPFHVDETFNFVYFADKGIWHSSIAANNHPLNNIIAAIWWKTGLSPEVSFRLTSILSSLSIHVLVYSATTHYFNSKVGIFVLMLSGVTFWGNVYAVEGVSYMLMSLWVVLAAIAVFSMREVPGRGRSLFLVSSVLGFYTNQLFIIPFVALLIFWFMASWYNRTLQQGLPRISAVVALTAIASMLLYFPMYLWSGFESTFHSDMSRHDLIEMSAILFEGFSVMTDIDSKSYIALIGLMVIGLIYFKVADDRTRGMLVLQVSIIISILIFSLIIGVYPPSRALVFTNILFYCSVGVIAAKEIFTRLGNPSAVVVLMLLISIKLAASVFTFNFGWQHGPMGLQDKESYAAINNRCEQILATRPNLIFSHPRYNHLDFYIMLNAIKKNQKIEITYDSTRLSEADVRLSAE